MKLSRLLLASAVLASMAGLALVAQQIQQSGGAMVSAADAFITSLKPDQKARASFGYDDAERTNWYFTPQQKNKKYTRKGLPLQDMTAEQKNLALALVKAGTSEAGNLAANTIMSLEAILRDQEGTKGANTRDPEWYFFSIFGLPGNSGKWGWRVEGHHLSLNFTMDGAQVVTATPSFFGANPAEVKGGANKGLRILASAEDLAHKLFLSLDENQKKIAKQTKPFPEPGEGTPSPKVGDAIGLSASKMTAAQKDTLRKLMTSYTDRMPADVAAAEWKAVDAAGFDAVTFAFHGEPALGKGHTYRVQGPSFVVEYLNMQADSGGNPANHIHSAWRRIKGDFGL